MLVNKSVSLWQKLHATFRFVFIRFLSHDVKDKSGIHIHLYTSNKSPDPPFYHSRKQHYSSHRRKDLWVGQCLDTYYFFFSW